MSNDDASASVTLCPDGPLLIRGDYILVDASGEHVDGHRGTVALCRCGKSALKPFCDGTHKKIGYHSERSG
jgi:CDGSH-type Zn-finger protein